MNAHGKIISFAELPNWRARFRQTGRRLAVTNGCFDLLHAGHVTYLQTARNQADALLVGVNGDGSVRELKGVGRPINGEADRALLVAALECVTAVCIFPEKTATRFLQAAQPDLYVKGGDYTLETLNAEERQAVLTSGGQILIIPFVPGKSTTALLKQLVR